MRALVVEDHAQIRQVVAELLRRRGHDVVEFGDADTAWSATRDQFFDLAILDWGLPGMDGIELCRRLRTRAGGTAGAILILTGRADPEDIDEVVAAGADDYLTKPFKLDWLEVRIAFAERKVADLAARARVDEELQQSEARFRSLVQKSTDLIVVVDRDGNLRYVSPAVKRLFPEIHRTEAPVNIFTSQRLLTDPFCTVQDLFLRTLTQAGGTVRAEIEVETVPGKTAILEVQATNLLDEPSVDGVVFNARDITENRAAEARLRTAEMRYRLLVEQIPAVVYVLRDGGDEYTNYLSPRIQSVLGYAPEEFLRNPALWDATIHPDDLDRVQTADALVNQTREPWRIEYRRRHRDGHYLWVRDEAELITDADGSSYWQGVFFDITELHEAAEALRDSEFRQRELLAAAERQAQELALLHEMRTALATQMDLPTVFQVVVEATARTFGYTLVSGYLLEGDELVLQHQVGYPAVIERIPVSSGTTGRVIRTNRPVLLQEGHADPEFLYAFDEIGSEICVPLHDQERPIGVLVLQTRRGTSLTEADLRLMTALAEHVDLAIVRSRLYTAVRESEARYRHQAQHDALTSLPNRGFFHEQLARAVDVSKGDRGGIAVLFLDLDGFKLVNDSLGHAIGDQLLIEVAQRLQAALDPRHTIARFGGDEFAILLDGRVGRFEAAAIAQRLLDEVRVPFTLDDKQITVGMSIGVALGTGAEVSPDDLLRNADIALYQAKGAGRATVKFYEPRQTATVKTRLEQEAEFWQAIERDELRMHVQPVVDLRSGEMKGVEALARWQHPTRGLLLPADFLRTAETAGLVAAFGAWSLRESCRIGAALQAQSPGRPLTIGVNLSVPQLRLPGVVATVASELDQSGLHPSQLQFEIPESVIAHADPAVVRALHELRELGVQIALDDFGATTGALTSLRELPVDTVSLDRSLIAGLGSAHVNLAIVRAVVGIARELSLTVTAEGIETLVQRTVLRSLGVERGQGFFFARPTPTADIADLTNGAAPLIGRPRAEARTSYRLEPLDDRSSGLVRPPSTGPLPLTPLSLV